MGDKLPPDQPLPTRTEAGEETVDLPEGLGFFSMGQVLGDRYEILEMLGRGGMGEVWRAFDLKLRVEVGLKALREELFQSERRLELLRQEVRAAREIVSPNVCRIFDLIEIDGRELVSMEYVDGATLLGVLQERGPLELKEAQDIASQFLAGLEAIHKAGLVHRDVKPENIMLTRAGRVVVMDFGLARGPESGAGSVSGTPAYMAPEHAAGSDVDARADVYSAGVVLAEMVSPDGIRSYESRQSVWEGVRSEPAQVPDSPWAPVIKLAVARDRERRPNSAHTLIRELEDVTLRVEGAEDLHPYPGLASFTEEDAEYFFGREAEVEQMWRKLEGPSRMLGIMGPSGAGKTSFIRAGVTPHAPPGWRIIRCTPGNAATASLRSALTPELTHRPELLQALMADPENPDVIVDAVAGWRREKTEALIIIDQFEELFTLSSKEDQHNFASLLGRLPLEDDIHILLSMRDDFAASCNTHQALQPIFHELTVLNPPTGGNLRRALVQPATACGYRFEDDELVDEMLAEVEGERGALPLLAFAMSRLWEKRDRDTGILTRQAYHDIGGVGGALARHAEATIDRIGIERIPIVRELFRNLVTAEGTRAVREWDELLSIFSDSSSASQEVLSELIDARLLTSYEVREDEHEPIRLVEIIHESLLANWPRLVRWQTQDQEGAQLRDELRQSARAWDEHGRHDDRLWTGTAYREYRLWRERYPGGLTEVEEAFAVAMTEFAGRRRRKRRLIVAAVMGALVAGLVVVGFFWQRSARETRRAEAANLLSLGQLELESYPSATVAHAIASLEQADGPGARRLALEALWKGPTAMVVTEDQAWFGDFHPDGQSLVQGKYQPSKSDEGHLSIINADGSREPLSHEHPGEPILSTSWLSEAGEFVSEGQESESSRKFVFWSLDEKKPLAVARLDIERSQSILWRLDPVHHRALFLIPEDGAVGVVAFGSNGEVERLGTLEFAGEHDDPSTVFRTATLDRKFGKWLGYSTETDVYVIDVGEHELGPPRHIGQHDGAVVAIRCDPLGRFVATAHAEDRIRLWDMNGSSPPTALRGPQGTRSIYFTPNGTLMYSNGQDEEESGIVRVWDITELPPRFLRDFDLGKRAGCNLDEIGRRIIRVGVDLEIRILSVDKPFDADPLLLMRGEVQQVNSANFDPTGDWLMTADATGLSLWPFSTESPVVLHRHELAVSGLAFAPEGSWLASAAFDNTVRLWPLEGDPPAPGRVLGRGSFGVAVSPDGARVLAGAIGSAPLYSSGEGPSTQLHGFSHQVWGVAFSPDGRLAAGIGGRFIPEERVIRIWDVESGEEVRVLEVGEEPNPSKLQFTPEGHLLSMSVSGLLSWNLETGERDLIYEGMLFDYSGAADGRRVALVEMEDPSALFGRAVHLDVDSGKVKPLDDFEHDVSAIAMDPTGTFVVTGDRDGEVRVGLVGGSEPHLFIGHENTVWAVAIDPKGRWIASGDNDGVIRLWPMPDLTKPPLHTLPREELIAKLKTLTNLRVARDPESSTGWTLTHDPFPGWETVPTW